MIGLEKTTLLGMCLGMYIFAPMINPIRSCIGEIDLELSTRVQGVCGDLIYPKSLACVQCKPIKTCTDPTIRFW